MSDDRRSFNRVPVNASFRLALRLEQLPLVRWWSNTRWLPLESEWINQLINNVATATEAARVITVLNRHVQIPLTILIAKHMGINSPGEQAAGHVMTAIQEWSF